MRVRSTLTMMKGLQKKEENQEETIRLIHNCKKTYIIVYMTPISHVKLFVSVIKDITKVRSSLR